ncbi:MAG TPA: VCBS repeat-containing protein [Gemmatimonadaceae bacterium]|nr:VCBS repeat-containing protein [Gemmatimonadaceae bacterium]
MALACSLAGRTDTAWHQQPGYRWRDLAIPRRGHPGFTQLTAAATGLTHRNDVDDEHALANRNLLIGAGVAVGDVDGDGLPDIFLASVEKPAALYHNDGHYHFTDVTAASGLDGKGLATTGAVFADVNGDGALDLIVGTMGGPLKLWLNDGKGHFTDATASSGLDSGYAVTTLTLADIDGNGTLDLYVATYKKRNALDVYPPQARAFDQVVKKYGGAYKVMEQWKAEFRIEKRSDLGGIVRSQRAEPDLFYLNDGKGHFTREPLAGNKRFTDENGKPLAAEPDYFTLAARFYDVNGDGAPDLYVCNDFEDPDQFWLNDGKGNFRLVPYLALRQTSNTCMSVDFADVNRDGYVDLFTADMLSPTLAARQRQIPTHTPLPKRVGLTNDRPQWMRNSLQLARGDGTWAQVADFAGVAATDWTWGSAFLDVDLDGYEDLLTVNGHRWDMRDADTFERIRNSVPLVPWNREQGEFPRLATRSVVLRNNGDVTFSDMSQKWGWGVDEAVSRGIALADFDGHGALDVIVTRLDGTPVVYRNETSANRIAVRLKGASPNNNGIGAVVTVRAPSLPVQSREMTAGGYYLSGSDAELVFATGRDAAATIEVRWRDGRLSTIPAARRNRLYEIDQAGAQSVPAPASMRPDTAPLFENATALLGGHTHVDSIYDDYRRQLLLPGKLSQLGPGVSWIDVDGDGREDLVVGTGRGGSLAILRNTGNAFTRTSPPGGPARWDLTTILPVPDGHGGTTLLAGQANYEANSPAEALSVNMVLGFPLRGGLPGAQFPVIPADTGSTGPLALADVNGDGRLDLFVGARVIPGAWPVPRPSRLYLGTADGRFVLDTTNAQVLGSLGLISAAVFADLDGDGWPDLVVAPEWGPIRVLHNDKGRFRDMTRPLALADTTSRWNGLAVGDFDGDGRLDIVATSWGRNVPWQASERRPYELLSGDFGGGGPGLLFARLDSATGKREMPLESFSRVGTAIPAARIRIATFTEYSNAGVDKVLGNDLNKAVRVGATTFDHTLYLNRGDFFDGVSLPSTAQIAPAFAAVVADFDGDGHEDLFLAQNFFPTEMGTPRFDAGAGLLLLGDGKGGLRAQSVRASGISVLGDQRGAAAADYDGDGRVDLAVSQNGAPTTLWHNVRGNPGIRVRVDAGPMNPLGIGAQLRVIAGTAKGPVREIHAGSGYWSMDGATTVLALPAGANAVWIRWPGGREETVPIAAGQKEIQLRAKHAAPPHR